MVQHLPSKCLVWDSSFLICLDFTRQLTSLSHRAANSQKGSNMHRKVLVWLREGSRMTNWWSSRFTHVREVLRSAAPQRGVETESLNRDTVEGLQRNLLKCICPNPPDKDQWEPVHQKQKKGKKCCIESILTSRTEILVLPFFFIFFYVAFR